MKKTFNFAANVNKKDKFAFNDALPIGNGHIGAMVYGGIGLEKLVLNENTFWLGNKNRKRYPEDYYKNYKLVQKLLLEDDYENASKLAEVALLPNPKGEAIYTTAGQLNIKFNHQDIYTNYQRTLDLENGIVTVSYDTNSNSIHRTYFASFKDDIIGIKISSKDNIEIVVSLDREKLIDKIEAVQLDELEMYIQFNQKDKFYCRVNVQADKEVYSIGSSIVARGTNIVIYVAMATTLYHRNPKAYTKHRIDYAVKKGYDAIYNMSIKDYQGLYHKQSFECNDKDMTYMYNLSRYLMISSSRFNLPSNLQGLWNQDLFPSWDSKYTININLQMNYWNVFGSNLFECFTPLLRLLEKMVKNGEKLAKKMYHCDGFVAHHNTDIYGDCGLQDHYMPASIWPLGAAWLSLMIYEYYEYTLDISFLKKYVYILNKASDFIKNILIEDVNGYKIICPSVSPENGFSINNKKYYLTKGVTMDDEIIHDLFTVTISANQILNQNSKFIEELRNILLKLTPIRISKYGTICEWHEDYDEIDLGHRHISHLYGLYPSNQITKDNEQLFQAAKNTLERRLENGSGHTGWSKAWIMAMYARLKDSTNAYKTFKEFYRDSTSRIGLDLHPPFQIDGNFGIASAIKELFIFDEIGLLEIIPAIPKELYSAKLLGFPIKGNRILDLEIDNGKIIKLEINSLNESILTIKIDESSKEYKLKQGINKII